MRPDRDLLFRLGYRPGKTRQWCDTGSHFVEGLAPNAFKCKRCATIHARRIDREFRLYAAETEDEAA